MVFLLSILEDESCRSIDSNINYYKKGGKRVFVCPKPPCWVVFLISTLSLSPFSFSLSDCLCTRETLHLKHPKCLDCTPRFAAVGRRRQPSPSL
ncbi:unnamed protein product [Lactuca virosa]|uniref:Uncharacterized protein n=1 Tax=Lactuca virosa TaxID=75947 RepID=A0AAU9N9J4_9ASTR|nr:unnamed protein product [Lactuca virosa]